MEVADFFLFTAERFPLEEVSPDDPNKGDPSICFVGLLSMILMGCSACECDLLLFSNELFDFLVIFVVSAALSESGN